MPRFPAKLLVLGEHTVVHGHQAYAVPLTQFGASLSLSEEEASEQQLEGPVLDFADWAAFAKTSRVVRRELDVDRWEAEAGRLVVDSDIPVGYGLGSSGAITAALIARYCRNAPLGSDFKWIGDLFKTLEDYFHGNSSGLDPAVSFYQRSYVVESNGRKKLSTAKQPLPDFGHAAGSWFLFDSGQPRAGKAAIAEFAEHMRDRRWQEQAFGPLTKLVSTLIAYHERGKQSHIDAYVALSELQARHLQFLIPEHVARTWQVLAKAEVAYLKLCGAGGGGYFLGYAPERSALEQFDASLTEKLVWLTS